MNLGYHPARGLKAHIESLRGAYETACKVVYAALGAGLLYRVYERTRAASASFGDWTSGGLTLVTLFVGAWWLWSPSRNLRLAEDWLSEPVDCQNPQYEWILAIGLGSIFGILLFAAYTPFLYSSAFVVYAALYLVGVRYYHAKLKTAIDRSRVRLEGSKASSGMDIQLIDLYREGLDALAAYHFGRPHERRIGLLLVAGLLATALSASRFIGFNWGSQAALVLLTVALLTAECAIIAWRAERDRKLSALEGRRSELEGHITESTMDSVEGAKH